MPRAKPVLNPWTDKELNSEDARFVRKLRKARAGARRMKRSGHPGRRAEAKRDEPLIAHNIRQVFINDLDKEH